MRSLRQLCGDMLMGYGSEYVRNSVQGFLLMFPGSLSEADTMWLSPLSVKKNVDR